jgi:hypothetical protein
MRSSPRLAWVLWAVGAGAAFAAPLGCGTERPMRIEDQARAMVPVPACILPLAARTHGAGQTMRNLTEDQYWQLVFPAYDAQKHQLQANALTCTGARVFDDPVFAGGTTRGSPIDVQEGDAQFGNGGDRVRIVWLRTHRWPDGSEAGAMALVRAKEDFAEVYAVGAYRRSNGELTMQAERLGTEVLVSATDDSCHGQPKTAACETNIGLYLPRYGKLARVATIITEKRAYAQGGEPGIQGQVEYELTASPQYTADGIKLFEQVQATDPAGRVVHKTQLERQYVLQDGDLKQGSESLWGKVYPGVASTQAPNTAPAPSAKTPATKP